MVNLIRSLTRKQKAYVFLAVDLALIPAALLFTFMVQALPVSPLESAVRPARCRRTLNVDIVWGFS